MGGIPRISFGKPPKTGLNTSPEVVNYSARSQNGLSGGSCLQQSCDFSRYLANYAAVDPNWYPIPEMVTTIRGLAGSFSIFLRNL